MVEGFAHAVAIGIAHEPDVAADVAAARRVLHHVDVAERVLRQVVRRIQLARGGGEAEVLRRLAAHELAHHGFAVAQHLHRNHRLLGGRGDVEDLVEVGQQPHFHVLRPPVRRGTHVVGRGATAAGIVVLARIGGGAVPERVGDAIERPAALIGDRHPGGRPEPRRGRVRPLVPVHRRIAATAPKGVHGEHERLPAAHIVPTPPQHQRVDGAGVPLVDVVQHPIGVLDAEVDAFVGDVGDALKNPVVLANGERRDDGVLRRGAERIENLHQPAKTRPLLPQDHRAVRRPTRRVEGGEVRRPSVAGGAPTLGGSSSAISSEQQLGAIFHRVVPRNPSAERRLVRDEQIAPGRIVGKHVEHGGRAARGHPPHGLLHVRLHLPQAHQVALPQARRHLPRRRQLVEMVRRRHRSGLRKRIEEQLAAMRENSRCGGDEKRASSDHC